MPREATGPPRLGSRSQCRARCGECQILSCYVPPGLTGKFRAIGKLVLGGRKNTSHAHFLYIGRRIYVFSHHLWLADPPHGPAWAASGKRLRRARPGKRIPASGPRQARSMRIYFGSIRAASVADISLAGAQFVARQNSLAGTKSRQWSAAISPEGGRRGARPGECPSRGPGDRVGCGRRSRRLAPSARRRGVLRLRR